VRPGAPTPGSAIRALPDLCFGIGSGRLGHLDPWTFLLMVNSLKALASPPGLSFGDIKLRS
jgi:hypothetical protein